MWFINSKLSFKQCSQWIDLWRQDIHKIIGPAPLERLWPCVGIYYSDILPDIGEFLFWRMSQKPTFLLAQNSIFSVTKQ